jgi:hypothetical protein
MRREKKLVAGGKKKTAVAICHSGKYKGRAVSYQ